MHTSEVWSKDTDVNSKTFLHIDDKQERRTTRHDRFAQREREQASEPEPDYMYRSEKTPTNSRQRGDVEIHGMDKERQLVDGTPNEKLDVITDTQQRKSYENIERVNKKRIDKLQQEVERLTKENDSLVQEKNTLQRKFETSDKELKQKYKECEEMYDQLEQVRRVKEHEKHALNKKIAALQIEVESLDGEVKRLTHEKNDALTRYGCGIYMLITLID